MEEGRIKGEADRKREIKERSPAEGEREGTVEREQEAEKWEKKVKREREAHKINGSSSTI